MDTLIMQDDSMVERTSMSDHPFNTQQSPRSTNPFEKANKNKLVAGRGAEGPEGAAAEKSNTNHLVRNSSFKSQSLFSNYYSGKFVLLPLIQLEAVKSPEEKV